MEHMWDKVKVQETMATGNRKDVPGARHPALPPLSNLHGGIDAISVPAQNSHQEFTVMLMDACE